METMILVAGLAVAGLAGIAAAFYFSMRPGGSRVRASGPDRAGDNRAPASTSRTSPSSSGASARSASPEWPARTERPTRSARPARAAAPAGAGSGRVADRTGAGTVIDFTGPQPMLDDSEPVVTGARARHGDRADGPPPRPTPTIPTTRPRRPGHVGVSGGERDPRSTRNCGRWRGSAVFPTSSS